MHNELRFAGWTVNRVGPIGNDWVRKLWLPKAREMLVQSPRREFFQRPSDHSERMQRALLSLEGLAIGDAVGEMLAYRHADAARIIERGLPAGPWFHTDDTEMAAFNCGYAEALRTYSSGRNWHAGLPGVLNGNPTAVTAA